MKNTKRRAATKPRPVNFEANEDDLTVALLGMMGASTKCIQRATKLTACQVVYRLGKANVKRMDYRNGESRAFKEIYRHERERLAGLFEY